MIKSLTKDSKLATKLILQVNDFSKGIDVTSGENVTSMESAVQSYNFNFNSGVLTEGVGFEEFTSPTTNFSDENQVAISYDDFMANIKSLSLFRHYSRTYKEYRDKIVFYADDGYMWYVRVNNSYPTTTKLSQLDFTSSPKVFNSKIDGVDVVIFSNGVDDVGTWNGDGVPSRWANCPKIISLCDYKGKLYYLTSGDQKYIKYSKNYNITQWTETLDTDNGEGVIEINDGQGKLNRLVCFQNHMYVFRDYSILKVTAYENIKEPSVTTVYMSGNKIYADTVQVCGNYMIMLTRDGLIKFDGLTATKIDLKFSSYFANIDNKNAKASFHAGKYYLACKLSYQNSLSNFDDATCVNNTLICYDVAQQKYIITRGVDILDLISMQSECLNKLILCFNANKTSVIGEINQSGKYFETCSQKYWISPLSDLGYSNKRKIIKDVSLISKYPCKITIFTESESKTFDINGNELAFKFPVRLCAKQVGFKIETDSDKVYISNLRMNIDLLENGDAI